MHVNPVWIEYILWHVSPLVWSVRWYSVLPSCKISSQLHMFSHGALAFWLRICVDFLFWNVITDFLFINVFAERVKVCPLLHFADTFCGPGPRRKPRVGTEPVSFTWQGRSLSHRGHLFGSTLRKIVSSQSWESNPGTLSGQHRSYPLGQVLTLLSLLKRKVTCDCL